MADVLVDAFYILSEFLFLPVAVSPASQRWLWLRLALAILLNTALMGSGVLLFVNGLGGPKWLPLVGGALVIGVFGFLLGYSLRNFWRAYQASRTAK
ncbi:hypothetical protein [Lacticaseibacillus mingshuiensis]|uniref:Uncharacterized protein n=1 Tax=Lacticaseibacillus mingshuiensis TaxID=2799574 RepID=A0ABW4CL85_9LACO|nr:hypothetical protein [Lacticaseibacillus mingshuiensis]